jgi:hypothetical protein
MSTSPLTPRRRAPALTPLWRRVLWLCALSFAALCAPSCEAPAETAEGAEAGAALTLTGSKADLPLADPWSEAGGARPQRGRTEQLISLYQDFIDDDLAINKGESPWDLTGCLVCGRETGFLPTPTLALSGAEPLDGKDSSYVSLSWEPVEGATEYRVVIVQVSDGEVVDVIDVDVTTTSLGVGLELGFEYFVYVVAQNPTSKRTSEPSAPLLLSCVEGDVCVSLEGAPLAP